MFPGTAEGILPVCEEKLLVGTGVECIVLRVDLSECRDMGHQLRSLLIHVGQAERRAQDLIGCSGALSFDAPFASVIN